MQGETAERILDAANALLINRGYSAFSYADIAETVKIRKASIHHHFPTKAGLVAAVLRRHRARISEGMKALDDQIENPLVRIKNYLEILGRVHRWPDPLLLYRRAFGCRDAFSAGRSPSRGSFAFLNAHGMVWANPESRIESTGDTPPGYRRNRSANVDRRAAWRDAFRTCHQQL